VIKRVYTIFLTVSFLVGLSGCGYNLQPKPEVAEKNSQIAIYVDDSASSYRLEQYIKQLLQLLNTEGVRTYFAYEFSDCGYKSKKYYKYGYKHDFKKFYVPYDRNSTLYCNDSKWLASKNQIATVQIDAKKIDNNRIEIATDRTYADILQKYVAIQSIATNKEQSKKLLAYGYLNVGIDMQAAKEKRLVLKLYPQATALKLHLVDALQKRGFTVVNDPEKADKIVYIENLAALPSDNAVALKQFYRQNFKNLMQKDIENIELSHDQAMSAKAEKNLERYHATAIMAHTGVLGTLLSGGSSESAGYIGLAILALGLLDAALATDPYEQTYVAYKVIVENKNPDENSDDNVEKYRYRPVIYENDILSFASLDLLQDKIFDDEGLDSIKAYIANFIENDFTPSSKFIKLPYRDFNENNATLNPNKDGVQ